MEVKRQRYSVWLNEAGSISEKAVEEINSRFTHNRDAIGARMIGGNIPKDYKIKLEERWARTVIRESGQTPDFILSQFRLYCADQKPFGQWTDLHQAGLNALVGHNDYQDQMPGVYFVVGL